MGHRDPKTHWTNERKIVKVNQGAEKRKKSRYKKETARLLCFFFIYPLTVNASQFPNPRKHN